MGYYTRFNLEYEPVKGFTITPEQLTELREEFAKALGFTEAFDELTSGDCPEWKWYECTEDMTKIAQKFPNILFTLEGEGEDREDWWIEQFCGETYHRSNAEIVPPTLMLRADDFSV